MLTFEQFNNIWDNAILRNRSKFKQFFMFGIENLNSVTPRKLRETINPEDFIQLIKIHWELFQTFSNECVDRDNVWSRTNIWLAWAECLEINKQKIIAELGIQKKAAYR